MNIKALAQLAGAASLLAVTGSANANFIPYDAWQLDTTNSAIGTSVTTDIGHLNLAGGFATVEQEVNGGGTPFVGARFSEAGGLFSITYTPENVAGLGDFGAPASLDNGLNLELRFSGLSGTVASYNAGTGEIEYIFTPGSGTVGLYGDFGGAEQLLASFSLISPSGGDLGDFNGAAGQTQGQSTITALVTSSISELFRDSMGDALDTLIADNGLFASVVTTNKISSPFTFSGPCSFDAGALCASGQITSDGSFDLLQVPAPGALALLGLGLVALGSWKRKHS